MNGERCPEVANAPQTIEGRAVLEALERPGAWSYAGMAAVPIGLDLPQALAALPGAIDLERAKRLLLTAEAAYLVAWREHNKDVSGKG